MTGRIVYIYRMSSFGILVLGNGTLVDRFNGSCLLQGGKNKLGAKAALSPHNDATGKSIEETYQKLSQLDHILLRPDTYIGSTEKQQQQLWVGFHTR